MKWIKNNFVAPYRFLTAVVIAVLVDLNDLFDMVVKQLERSANYWETKSVAGCVIALLVEFNRSDYAVVVQSIFWLVILDILSKFFAISNQNLIQHGVSPDLITTRDKFLGWLLAFRDKKITTAQMTDGFITKMIYFSIILLAANLIDNTLCQSEINLPISVVTFCIGYIMYSEFLSIVENLRDSGVPHMDRLIELLTSNIFNKLKK